MWRRRGGRPKFLLMTPEPHPEDRLRRTFLLVLTVGISLLFLYMIRQFLLSVLLAAIFAGLVNPVYRFLLRRLRGRKTFASVGTVTAVVVVVGLPLLAFFGLVASQAVEVSQAAGPWIERQIGQAGELEQRIRHLPILDRLPGIERVLPSSEQVMAKVGEVASATGSFLVRSLAQVTRGTLGFFLQLFVVLYAMFFFLADGRMILDRILFYMPLPPEDETRLLEKFVSVARATLKGSLLIGLIQGALAGVAFWAAGVPGAAFWGTVTVVSSLIPAVGAAIVWIPMVIYLFLTGHNPAAVGLLLWSALVVSTIDNVLRPVLVGRDTRMSDLLVLLSTLGGIVLFGAVGFIVGPIVAALFVTVWHLYGETFGEWLPGSAPEEVMVPSSHPPPAP
jgi:predicted PurR-regulated permease PerM